MVSQTTLEKEFAFLREQYAVTREQEVQMTKMPLRWRLRLMK